jgi:O-antigen ligase
VLGLNIRAEAEIASATQRSPQSDSLEDAQRSRRLFKIKISNPVLLLSALTIFLPLIEGGATHLPVLVVRVLLVVSVMVWTFGQMKRQALTLPRSNLFLVAVLFLGWAGLTLCWTPYQDVSVQSFMNLLMSLLLYGVVLQGIRSDRQVRQVVGVLIGMGLIEGLLGVVQYFFLDEARARGTFFNPNFFALYEVSILMVALGLLSFRKTLQRQLWESVLLWVTVGVTLAAFIVAQSRGAFFGFVAAMVFLGLTRFGKIGLLALALVVFMGVIVPNPMKQRFIDVAEQDPYAFTRFAMWKDAMGRVVDQPMGIGLGMYKYASFQYRFPIEHGIARYKKRAESAHNEYLQMAVEMGVGGLLIFLAGLAVWAREVRGILRGQLEPLKKGYAIGLSAATIGLLAHSAVDSVFHEPTLLAMLILCGGMVLALRLQETSGGGAYVSLPFSYHPVRAGLVLFSGLILLVLAIQPAAGWYAFDQGEKQAQAGQVDLAAAWYQRAVRISPGTTVYHDALARASVQLFHLSGAPKLLVDAVEEESLARELNPLDGRFPYRLGTIYRLLAEQKVAQAQRDMFLNQAAQAFEEAIKVDPFYPPSYLDLANIRLAQGRTDEATVWLQEVVQTEPNFLPARMLLAGLALAAGEHRAAQSEYDEIVAIKERYEGQGLGAAERQFLDIDLYPLGRRLALEAR